MTPLTVVMLSTTDWDAPQFGSRQQIASRLVGRGHRVLFVEPPRSVHSVVSDPQGTRRAVTRFGRIRQVSAGPLVYTPLPILPIPYHPWTHAVNRHVFLASVRQALTRLQWRVDVVWTYWPHTGHLVTGLAAPVSVYHCIDDFTAVEYPLTPAGAIAAYEAEQCQVVDWILARSERIAAARRGFNASVHVLPGGVDLDHFDPAMVTDDHRLEALRGPRVGFLGTLDDRFDVDLVVSAIRRLPDMSFAFVGPIKRHLVDVRALTALSNVRFFPPCAHADAPAVVAAFDACIIPYRVNAFTAAVTPVKLYEYLAMGKPVIATGLPYLERERAHIRIAQTPDDFAVMLQDAVSRPLSAAEQSTLRTVASAYTWDRQLDAIECHLDRIRRSKR